MAWEPGDCSNGSMVQGEGNAVQVRLWQRYGKRRLYVDGADGRTLGWCDPDTGVEHPEPGVDLLELRSIVGAHLARNPLPPPAAKEAQVVHPRAFDVAWNRPGAGPGRKADALRAAGASAGELRPWQQGAIGEMAVGQALDSLVPYGGRVLHSVPVGAGGADIDHLVFTPGGVFVVNTKHHDGSGGASVWCEGGRLYVRGHPTDHLERSRAEAELVARRLSAAAQVPVLATPVLAIVGAEVQLIEPPHGVIVLPGHRLVSWLWAWPRILSDETVAHLFGWARISSTWVSPDAAPTNSARAAQVKATPAPTVPGRWEADPHGRYVERWFDGAAWTGRVRDGGGHSAFDSLLGRRPVAAPGPSPAAGDPAPIVVEPWHPTPRRDPDLGTGGASAQREYERRAGRERAENDRRLAADATWRADVVERRPILGRIATGLTPKVIAAAETQSTTAWAVGAMGERQLAHLLDGLGGVRALHDRRIPGSRANIDHIAVAPWGVAVIDAKRWKGAVEVRTTGPIFRPQTDLYVGGRKRTEAVHGMARQVEAVRAALGPHAAAISVEPILCFIDAEWPRFRAKAHRIDAVTITFPDDLRRRLHEPRPAALDVEAIVSVLAAALRPA